MMSPAIHSLLSLLLIAGGTPFPLDARYPDATQVFYCDFGEKWDANYDGWPDRWTRRHGEGYPHYVEVNISEEPSPAGDRCLRVELDGGGAVAYSPPIEIGPLYSFVVEGFLKTDGLKYDRAYYSLTFLDSERKRLETHVSEAFRQTDGWQKVRIGPIAPKNDNAAMLIVGLHVEPGDREDLHGTVCFDDVWVGRLPRLSLATNRPFNLFIDNPEVEIVCNASGFKQRRQTITLQLTDAMGNELLRTERELQVQSVDSNAGLSLDSFAEGPSGLVGRTQWKPEIPGPGFYRVRAAMESASAVVHRRELSLAVLESKGDTRDTEFGWTLPYGDDPLPLDVLAPLIAQAGVGWVKYPLWYGESPDEKEIERLVTFIERISRREIRLVGLLADPPKQLREKYGSLRDLNAVDLFAPDPEVWYPSLEPVLTRLATRVRWWQLGGDLDTSFINCPNLVAKAQQIKAELDRIGQDVNLGMGWSWIDQFPEHRPMSLRDVDALAVSTSATPDVSTGAHKEQLAWRFLALSAEPPMTYHELARHLDATENARAARWVVLRPISKRHYSPEVRATDLVNRMIAARIHGAEAIFCPNPFDDEHGLMNEDGTPGELLLPWRTAALTLAGAEYIGAMQLPGGSDNQVFARKREAVMVVWNEQPTEEVLYLGPNVRQIDLWGHEVDPEQRDHRQVIHADRVPKIITGLDLEATRMRMSTDFARKRLPSVFGHPHKNALKLVNHFDRGVAGQMTVRMPEGWMAEPTEFPFRLAEGEPAQWPMTITFPYNANAGRQPVRIDVEVEGTPTKQFSIYRHIDVGLGFVYVKVRTWLNEKGELEVEQHLVNDGDGRVSFRCQLFIPGRRRQMTQVLSLPRGQDTKVYRIEDGAELIGEDLWLRAEELQGPRVLNYRFTAEK